MKDYLKNKRIIAGLTQAELAEIVNLPQQQIAKYESGLTVPSAKTLINLSIALKFNLNDLKAIFQKEDK